MSAVHAPDVSELGPPAPPAPQRSVRRATSRRASTRRAFARSRQPDHDAAVIALLADHPNRTTGELAKRLNLDPDQIAISLRHLTSTGEIEKTAHGYRIPRSD